MTLILLMMSELTLHSQRVTLPRKIWKDLYSFFFLFDFSIYFSLFFSLFFVAFLLCIYSIFFVWPCLFDKLSKAFEKTRSVVFQKWNFSNFVQHLEASCVLTVHVLRPKL